MDEYIGRGTAIAKLTALEVTEPNATMTDVKQLLADIPAADVEKCQTDTILSQTCMNKGSFCLLLLPKIIRMHGKASGMMTAAFLSAGDGSSWVLKPTKDVTHTTMS